jgi:hypothetical protein
MFVLFQKKILIFTILLHETNHAKKELMDILILSELLVTPNIQNVTGDDIYECQKYGMATKYTGYLIQRLS